MKFNKTTKYQVQLRDKNDVFKLKSKKYQMQVGDGHNEAVFLVGAVEFDKDAMKKQLAMQKIRPGDKDFETSDSPYRERVVLLEILHDNKVAG